MDRFWSKVDKSAGQDACWPWVAEISRYGYGVFAIGSRAKATFRKARAHRIAYQLANGVDPVDLCVMHSCDNRRCCNPAHLSLGASKENTQDRHSKGRSASGEAVGLAKLTEQEVRDIRTNYALCRVTQKQLAERYSVDQTLISMIVLNKIWRREQETI